MEKFPQNNTENQEIREEEFNKQFEKLMARLEEKYGPSDVGRYTLHSQLRKTAKIFGSLDQLKGKRILDLGCGSTIPKRFDDIVKRIEEAKEKSAQAEAWELFRKLKMSGVTTELIPMPGWKRVADFAPWFCRALVELGAAPVGIDVGNLEGEVFEHYNVDLRRKDAINFLPEHSFDAVNARLFISSPELGIDTDKEAMRKMSEQLSGQVQRVLKDGGVIIEWTE